MAADEFRPISANELYTIEELAKKLKRSERWVYDRFIRPVDDKTRKPVRDELGGMIAGVYHFQHGGVYLVPGSSLIAWVGTYGSCHYEEDDAE